MKTRFIFLIPQIFFSNLIFAGCDVPNGGAKYDALVKVSQIGAGNSYSVRVPKKLRNYQYIPTLVLAYTKAHSDGSKEMEYSAAIDVEETYKDIIGTFSIEVIKGVRPYIQAHWPPNKVGGCGVLATSRLL